MRNGWSELDDDLELSASSNTLSPDAAVALVHDNLARGRHESWFGTETGRSLAVVTNGERAMVMLLEHEGDAGEHAVDRSARASSSTGYRLNMGQMDTYEDGDTVPLSDLLRHVRTVFDGAERSADSWHVDR